MGMDIVDEREQSSNMKQVAKQKWRDRVDTHTHLIEADSEENQPKT